MELPKTLLEMSQTDLTPVNVSDAVLILIDMQNEYLDGPLMIKEAKQAVSNTAEVLAIARREKSHIIHIAHSGRPDGLFDRNHHRGQIIDPLQPVEDEILIEKQLPNAFAGTHLQKVIDATGCKDLLIFGFMTHMCVSSTARAALDLGYRVTVNAEGCATRDLPDGRGGVMRSNHLHEAALVALSDRFAVIARNYVWK